MLDGCIALAAAEYLDADALGGADTREVVAHEVNDHHVFGPVLGALFEVVAGEEIGLGARDHPACPFDRMHPRDPPRYRQQSLRRHARDLHRAGIEARRERGRIDHPGPEVEECRVGLAGHGETLREVDLKNVAGPDKLDSPLHHLPVAHGGVGRHDPGMPGEGMPTAGWVPSR